MQEKAAVLCRDKGAFNAFGDFRNWRVVPVLIVELCDKPAVPVVYFCGHRLFKSHCFADQGITHSIGIDYVKEGEGQDRAKKNSCSYIYFFH